MSSVRVAVFSFVFLTVLSACNGNSGTTSRDQTGGENFGPPTSEPSNQPLLTNAEPSVVAGEVQMLLHASNSARLTVQDTVNKVGSCELAPADGQRVMDGAIASRRQVLDKMTSLGFESLANGARLRAELGDAMTASIEAGRDFQAWMGFVAASGCRGTAPHDANWDAAFAASERATAAKQAFVADWNPVAAGFGFPAWQQGDI